MGNKFKLTILASVIFATSFIMPMPSIIAIEYDSDNYIEVLENSDIYKELVSSEGLDENAVVNFFDHKFKEDEGIILVTGMVKKMIV